MTALSWDDVRILVALGPKNATVYGIPRGGSIIAALLTTNNCTPVATPDEAEIIVDDILDSGDTRDRYHDLYPGKPFWVACVKSSFDWVTFPWEDEEPGGAETNVVRLLQALGEDVKRDGLIDTPRRVVKALKEMTVGYAIEPTTLLKTVFDERYDEMVVVKDIPFWSLCEHHLLPFHGTATVGYLPHGRVVGLSKIPRLVHAFARRLQVQERLTQQIAETLMDGLVPLGAGCIITARHTCMASRGVGIDAPMVTSCLLGALREGARAEFLAMGRSL